MVTAHVRFGGRGGETERPRGRHRAPARPYLASEALDALRRADWQALRRTDPEAAKSFKGLRFILRRRADGLEAKDRSLLEALAKTNERVYHGWLLTDQLRAVYQAPDPEAARDLLDAWIFAAATSGLSPFVGSSLHPVG